MQEASDKGVVEVAEAQKRVDLFNARWCWPLPNAANLRQVHVCYPLFKDYPQVIDAVRLPLAFFGLQEEVSCLMLGGASL
jgi:hypothetical protein